MKRRIQLEEEEEKKKVDDKWRRVEKMRVKEGKRKEREWKRQELWKKKKEEKRKREIAERRCFVCGIFRYMAHYCRNRREEGLAQVLLNKFEVLKSRVMQKGERSGKEVVKDRREILKEERVKKRKIKVEKKDKKDKKDKKENNKKEEILKERKEEEKKVEKREQEMKEEKRKRGFSRREILRGRYSLVWQKVWCYKCGGIGQMAKDHLEKK